MSFKNQLLELTRKKYVDQAKWWLNGFWQDGAEQEAESIWKFTNKFIELDDKNKKEGCELDEFQAHKFLESLGETLTVIALRDKLRKIDLDANGKMALLEYFMFKYAKTPQAVIDAPQGGNTKEIDEAQEKLNAVQTALADLQNQLEEQQKALVAQKEATDAAKKALEEQKRTAEQARVALESQKSAEEAVKKAEAEQRAAVEDLARQEESYKAQIQTLESKSKDANASTVQKNKAAAELAQVKQEDPLPLRKAKITQEAALRKVEKERKAAEAATAKAEEANNKAVEAAKQAEQAALEAEQKTLELEEQTKRVEQAIRDTEDRFREAQEYLAEVKKKGVASGAIWWMERELKEAQKYLPKNKQK